MKNKRIIRTASKRSTAKIGWVGLSLALVSGSSFAYYCAAAGNPSAVASLRALLTEADTSESLAIQSLDGTVSSAIQVQTERLSTAIKILTKQDALAAQSISDNSNRNSQSFVAAYQAVRQAQAMKEAEVAYGTTGQGYKTCEVLAERESAAGDFKAAEKSILTRVGTEVVAAPGVYLNRHQAQKGMLEAHNEFCTQAQAASGMCNVGKSPGLNLQGATLFTPSISGSPVYRAQNGLINFMVGLPDTPIDQKLAKTSAGQDYMMAKLAKDATISPAISSLKAIQAQYSPTVSVGASAHDTETRLAPIQHLEKGISRYLGTGEEYKNWAKAQAVKDERGLMVDGLVLMSEILNMQNLQYKSNERKEAVLASLVSTEAKFADGSIDLSDVYNKSAPDIRRIALSQQLVKTGGGQTK